MSRRISKYPYDADPTEHDKVIGTDSGSGQTTLNYRVGDLLYLVGDKYVEVQLTYKFYNDGNATEANLGVFTTDSDVIADVTEININRYNINSDDMTALMSSIEGILPTYDVFLNISDTRDPELYGYFKVSSITDNTSTFTINGGIEGGVANGSFLNESYYFMRSFFYKIQTAQPSTVPEVTWTEFINYSPKNNGDRFNITSPSDSDHGNVTFGFVTLISSKQFLWTNDDGDIETIITD